MTDWLTRSAPRLITIGLVAALIIAFAMLKSCGTARRAQAEARLATAERSAAIESGSDAVQTLGNAMANQATIQQRVKEGTNAINQAPGGDSNDAADNAACRLRSYRHSGKCIALLGPVAD